MKQSPRRRARTVEVDTSVVISGMSAFRGTFLPGRNSSADVLHEWVEKGSFVRLVTAEILEEYKEVARRLGDRPDVADRLINLLKEEAEEVVVRGMVEIAPDPLTDLHAKLRFALDAPHFAARRARAYHICFAKVL